MQKFIYLTQIHEYSPSWPGVVPAVPCLHEWSEHIAAVCAVPENNKKLHLYVYRWLFKIRRGVSISAIFVSKGIDGFNVLGGKLIYSFMKRSHTSENPLIQAIVPRGKFEDSAVNWEWTKALYKGH